LFFEFSKAVQILQPKYWLLENVVMRQEYQDTISGILGVKPVEINSRLVSAQNHRRLYWANFPITQPDDKGILLRDILEDHTYPNRACIVGRKILEGKRADKSNAPLQQYLEVREQDGKSFCLTTVEKDNVLTCLSVGRYLNTSVNNALFRHYTNRELCRLQTVPEKWMDGLSKSKAYHLLGNAWTIDVVAHIFAGIAEGEI
jgi:site-specific DNA-cytosine methylase